MAFSSFKWVSGSMINSVVLARLNIPSHIKSATGMPQTSIWRTRRSLVPEHSSRTLMILSSRLTPSFSSRAASSCGGL